MSAASQGQILPPRNVRGMSVIPPKAALNADIFIWPVRADIVAKVFLHW
jgi:hypothetical protein